MYQSAFDFYLCNVNLQYMKKHKIWNRPEILSQEKFIAKDGGNRVNDF